MRKVKFKKFIPITYKDVNALNGPIKVREDGTGMLLKDYCEEGFFHKWILKPFGGDHKLIAIVELSDGSIQEVDSYHLKFLESEATLPKPEFVCPYIARFELWIQDKISKEDFKEVVERMDKIREIATDLRHYANHFKTKCE